MYSIDTDQCAGIINFSKMAGNLPKIVVGKMRFMVLPVGAPPVRH